MMSRSSLPVRPALAALALAAVAGCVRAPEPSLPPPVAPVPIPTPRPAPPVADWQDRPVTPGTWRYDRDARGSRALFGTPGTDALVVLRCDLGQRATYLSRAGAATGAFTIRTTSATRTLAVRPTGGALPYAAATLPPRDPLLDAIAFSRGRFTLEQAGATTLVLPPWAEVARVVEDCRG